MTPIEILLIIGMIVGFIVYIKHDIKTFPACIVLKVDTHGKNNPDLVIGISKIVEQYDRSVIIERTVIHNSCSMNNGKLWIQISTIKRHKNDIIKDISCYMTQGFAYLSYELC